MRYRVFPQFPPYSLWLFLLLLGLPLTGCQEPELAAEPPPLSNLGEPSPQLNLAAASPTVDTTALLQESWQVYRQQFVQTDGRVIDREASDRSISEGQAYAMLRAVLIDDPDTFALTLKWAEDNLQRRDARGQITDSLWAWKWGQDATGKWDVLDNNFASDADLDAITALILAARRWNRPDYLQLARTKLKDLWELSTVVVAPPTGRIRYFIPGPQEAFFPQPQRLYLNPSYLAPYAFRLFAQVDPDRDWLTLIESSYQILNDSAVISALGLPSDWVALDTTTGRYAAATGINRLQSVYGFDAYRVWWRIAIDAAWFGEPRAQQYLQRHLQPLQALWRSQQSIPAQFDLQGNPMVEYESTAHYAMLYAAFQLIDPETARQIRAQKLMPAYQDGLWDSDSAYYTQNLGWFGLFSASEVATSWLRP